MFSSEPTPPSALKEVPLPDGVELRFRAMGVLPVALGWLVLSLLMGIISIVRYITNLPEDARYLVQYDLAPTAALALVVGYFALAAFINTTRIAVTPEVLTIYSGPIRVPGGKSLPATDIYQIYVRKDRTTFSLHAIVMGDEDRTLIRGLPDADIARYIEWQIEQRLDIHDRPVSDDRKRKHLP